MAGEIDTVNRAAAIAKTVPIRDRINIKTSGEIRRTLAETLRLKPAKVYVDLSGVSYIDTSGIATLIEAARIARQQGTQLMLQGIHDQPRYFFEITHLDRLFDIAQPEALK